LLILLKSGKGRDIIIHVGKGTENETFELHSGILYVRCPYFSNELDELDYNENHIKEISKPNISVDVFRVIIT
ncbi:3773_t:CDS:1, partial [Cetraspora pellucida]